MKQDAPQLRDEDLDHMDNASLPNGSVYTGQARSAQKDGQEIMVQHGTGTQVWPDGKKYEGDFRDGLAHGRGTLTHANGDIYMGEYQTDECHGYGAYIH